MEDSDLQHVELTSEDWSKRALNIHGTFFERWCQNAIQQHGLWRLTATNYPVMFLPANGPLRGRESNLDIRAEFHTARVRATLLIECKKNNPDFHEWVFFPLQSSQSVPSSQSIVVCQVANVPRSEDSIAPGSLVPQLSLAEFEWWMIETDEGRETKGEYRKRDQSKTRTSNTAIYDASTQLAIARQAIASQEVRLRQTVSNIAGSASAYDLGIPRLDLFIPVIVTTARLFTCEFNVNDIDATTGEIALDKVRLVNRPHLVYRFPLPPDLQAEISLVPTTWRSTGWDRAAYMPVVVVNSLSLTPLLDRVAEWVRSDVP